MIDRIEEVLAEQVLQVARGGTTHIMLPTNASDEHCMFLAELGPLSVSVCAREELLEDDMRALSRYRTSVKSLWGNGNTRITDKGVEAIAASLTNLRDLRLAGCEKLTDASLLAIAEHLTKVVTLDFRNTSVGAAGMRAIAQLSKLRSLNLGWCKKITDDALRDLATRATRKRWFSLRNLRTTNRARGSEFFPKLRDLWLNHTSVTEVPEELIRQGDAQAIFAHVLAKVKHPLHEARLVLLGEGGVGKTNVRVRLIGESKDGIFYHEPEHFKTHDIEMRSWPVKARMAPNEPEVEVAMRAWDFGGQPHLHASHRFFLSAERNVYLLVLDATRSRKDNRLDYWLSLIAHEAKDAPVVVLVTKCDDERQRVWKEVDHDVAQLRLAWKQEGRRFPNVVDDVVEDYGWSKELSDDEKQRIRARHREAHKRLVAAIRNAIPRVKGVVDQYPEGFFTVKEWLEKCFPTPTVRQNQPAEKYISRQDYFKECKKARLDKAHWKTYLPVYRNLGLCLWVGDRKDVKSQKELEDFLFNPAWAKGPMYNIVEAPSNYHNDGLMTQAQLEALLPEHDGDPNADGLWKRHPFFADERRLILDLMLACGLCFNVEPDENGPRYLIADRLRTRKRDGSLPWTGDDVLPLIVRYDFLPDDVLMRFVAKWYKRLVDAQTTCWRDEIIVKSLDGRCEGLLQSDVLDRTIHVSIRGGNTPDDRLVLWGRIQETLDEIEPKPSGANVLEQPRAAHGVVQSGDGKRGGEVATPPGTNTHYRELSEPMSRAEFARRVLCKQEARAREAKPLLERYGFEQFSSKKIRVRLDTMDPKTRQKVEKSR